MRCELWCFLEQVLAGKTQGEKRAFVVIETRSPKSSPFTLHKEAPNPVQALSCASGTCFISGTFGDNFLTEPATLKLDFAL